MARIPISDLYRREGPGEKYGGILNAVFQEIFSNGIPEGCDERTWIKLLTVKHTFLTAKKMAEQGDVVSELTEAAPPFCAAEQGAQLCSSTQQSAKRPTGSGAHCAPAFVPPPGPWDADFSTRCPFGFAQGKARSK